MHNPLCTKCNKNEAISCWHLQVTLSSPNGPEEHDCTFPWEDTMTNDLRACEECPLLWCQDCKDIAIINMDSIGKAMKPDEIMTDDEVQDGFEGYCPQGDDS